MNTPSRAAFRGRVTAAAYVVDVAAIGEATARARVLARWGPGCRLSAVDDTRWLFVLGTPEPVRADLAPGLPLVGGPDGLAPPDEPVTRGVLRLPRAGVSTEVALAALPAVDLRAWLDPSDLPPRWLQPVEAAPTPVAPAELAPVPEPDLRALAGIGPATPPDLDAAAPVGRGRVVLLVAAVLLGVVAIAAVVTALVSGGDPARVPTPPATVGPTSTPAPSTRVIRGPDGSVLASFPPIFPTPVDLVPPPDTTSWTAALRPAWIIAVALLTAAVVRAFRRRRSVASGRRTGSGVDGAAGAGRDGAGRGGAAREHPLRDRLTGFVLGTPAGGFIGRRHERYLRRLTEDFQQGRWDEALTSAIGLGGGSRGTLSLRVPPRRSSLSPAATPGRGSTTPYGGTVAQHLRELYRDAAGRLERDGRVDRAAFVLAVLLHDPAAAVALLERHGDPALAAEVAESRRLDPSLVVRLWWQAGRRDRAVEVARARGAYAAAVTRLEHVDAGLARELRQAWVDDARAAGDAVTAVDAAWPDATLRRAALPDVRAGLEAGGPAAGYLLARFLSGGWDLGPLTTAGFDLLAGGSPAEAAVRTSFLTAFATSPASDPQLDRRLASAAAVAVGRDPALWAGTPARTATRLTAALRDRADPLLAADLPPPVRPTAAARPAGGTAVELAGEPGLLPVTDAVALPDGSVLVALGALGLVWQTPDGRARATWSLPIDGVVLADHARAAVLVRAAGRHVELHRLDLRDRRVRPWTTLQGATVADSFDGGRLVTVDDDGIAVFDLLADRPRVGWRELSPAQGVVAIGRTPTTLTALARAEAAAWARQQRAGTPAFELFTWDLPSMTLRMRRRVEAVPGLVAAVVTPSHAVQVHETLRGLVAVHARDWESPVVQPLPAGHRVTASGDTWTTIGPGDRGGFVAVVSVRTEVLLTVRGPGDPAGVGVRRHGDVVTVHDGPGGRVVGVDTARGAVATRTRSGL